MIFVSWYENKIIRSFDELEIKEFALYSEMNDVKIKSLAVNCKINSNAAIALSKEYRIQCDKFNQKYVKEGNNIKYISVVIVKQM